MSFHFLLFATEFTAGEFLIPFWRWITNLTVYCRLDGWLLSWYELLRVRIASKTEGENAHTSSSQTLVVALPCSLVKNNELDNLLSVPDFQNGFTAPFSSVPHGFPFQDQYHNLNCSRNKSWRINTLATLFIMPSHYLLFPLFMHWSINSAPYQVDCEWGNNEFNLVVRILLKLFEVTIQYDERKLAASRHVTSRQ